MYEDSNENVVRQVLIEDSTYAQFGLRNKAEVRETPSDKRDD